VCLLAVAMLGCGVADASAPPKAAATQPIAVQTTPVVARAVPRLLPLTGTLTAELRTELTANATGRVVKTFVERGQRVERGALLAQLDVRSARASVGEAQASLASAQTQLEAARKECERNDALVAHGAITKQEHERQTASCKQQLAAVAVSEARASSTALAVGDGTIRAPFSGVVTERMVSVGDYVQPPSKVVTLIVSSRLRLQMTVPERRVGEVEAGALVTFSPPALPDRTFSGTVKYLSGEVRAATRDIVVEAVVPNADGLLLPGMFVNVNLHTGEQPMPVVPKAAIFTTGEEQSLYVVEQKHLALRIVQLGVQAGDDIAVEAGVAVGELVVVNPSPSMSDGAPVE
jgi:RND family efflux transporter MFP subunit